MSDLISRQMAIDAFERFIHELGIEDEPYNYGEMALSAQNVPSVENKGEWILYGYVSTEQIENCTERYCCSKCHNIISRDFRYFKFCPNCGADMRGKAE
jgi:hypothetical protein